MKLNIGSGYKRIPGYLNVDHDPLVNPDFLQDLENLKLNIPDNSVDFEIVYFSFMPYPKWEQRFEKMTNEQIEEVVMDYNNVFYEVNIQLKVIK